MLTTRMHPRGAPAPRTAAASRLRAGKPAALPTARRGAESFWPAVRRVIATGARAGRPVFRVIGGRLGPGSARQWATRLPGVFVRGNLRQVRSFANSVGGQLVGPEIHAGGIRHYHLLRPDGDRIHVWYGPNVPRGEFYE